MITPGGLFVSTTLVMGTAIDPALIFASESSSLQSSWFEQIGDDKKAFIGVTPSVWSNNDMGLAWLTQVFDRATKPKARRLYRLLIVDGHGFHLTKDFIDHCDCNKILLAVFPPHATYTLQPLDVCVFKSLLAAYSPHFYSEVRGRYQLLKETSLTCSRGPGLLLYARN